MLRGEVWTMRDKGYASKARPVIVIQSNSIDSFDSVILCLLTSFESEDASTRVELEPSQRNGLERRSYALADKIVTVDKNLLGEKIGMLSFDDMTRVDHALQIALGL